MQHPRLAYTSLHDLDPTSMPKHLEEDSLDGSSDAMELLEQETQPT